MKLLVDFFPLLAFFISYKLTDIYTATAVLMAASSVQVAYLWFKNRRLETMPLVVLGFALVFGTLTLVMHDELFLKWKVSVVEWLFALLLLGAPLFGRNLLKELLDKEITLPDSVWSRLNIGWGLLFFVLGTVNVYFIYFTSTDTWVNFKVWGLTVSNLVAIALTGVYIARHLPKDTPDANNENA